MRPLTGTQRARHDIAAVFKQFALAANMAKMIATRVLPGFNVELAHGTYPVINAKELMKRSDNAQSNPDGYAAARAPRGPYKRNDRAFGQATYSTMEHGFEEVIDANEQSHYSNHFDHELTQAEACIHNVMLEREIRTARLCFSTVTFPAGVQSHDAGTYDGEASNGGAATPWSDWANASPRDDIFYAKGRVFQRTGVMPQTLAINEQTLRNLRMNEQIRQEWIANGAGSRGYQEMLAVFDPNLYQTGHIDSSQTAIAEVLDVQEIVVGCAVMDANNANDPTFAPTYVWDDSALLFKRVMGTGAASLTEIGLGHTFQWNQDPNRSFTARSKGAMDGFYFEDYFEDDVRAQILRCRHQDMQVIKYRPAGELITSV